MSPRRAIGIDAGGTKLVGGVVDEQLVVHHRVHRSWRGADSAETLDIMVGAVEEIRAVAPDVRVVGFGVPALVDRGVSIWSNHLPLDGVRLGDLLGERLDLDVRLDNDVNAAILAEHSHGAARGARHAVMLALGTGIGGGLVIDGRLHRGARGFAGELGHMTVDLHGEDCPGDCPGRGCFETIVSGRAIGVAGERAGRESPGSTLGSIVADGREVTGGLVTELAHDGDEQARGILATVGERLGIGIAGLVNALDPDVVVVGGGAIAAGDLLLDPARAALAERALPPGGEPPPIVPARFGAEAGMLGAALLALEEAA
ncbi:MAG: ROK family protein [Thermoleophilaceae bacterium]